MTGSICIVIFQIVKTGFVNSSKNRGIKKEFGQSLKIGIVVVGTYCLQYLTFGCFIHREISNVSFILSIWKGYLFVGIHQLITGVTVHFSLIPQ